MWKTIYNQNVAGHWFQKNKSQDRPCCQDAVSFDEIAQLEDEKRRAVESEEMWHCVAGDKGYSFTYEEQL